MMVFILGSLWGEVVALAVAAPPGDMVALPEGSYRPLFQDGDGPTRVAAFYLDRYAVTNAQYLAFVTTNPRFRRSSLPRLFADASYLRHWQDGLHPAQEEAKVIERPVTYVSWFAARAYCQWQQKRLPSTAEWEYAAQASADHPDGRQDPSYFSRILAWYARPNPPRPAPMGSGGQNYWGVYDLHGVVWEWVADFQTALVTGASRGDIDFERNLFCGAGTAGVTEAERVNYPAFMRYAYRSSLQGAYTLPNLGFRCAKDAEGTAP
jgi:formylglycine-generating enzyme required for sulfatase activity